MSYHVWGAMLHITNEYTPPSPLITQWLSPYLYVHMPQQLHHTLLYVLPCLGEPCCTSQMDIYQILLLLPSRKKTKNHNIVQAWSYFWKEKYLLCEKLLINLFFLDHISISLNHDCIDHNTKPVGQWFVTFLQHHSYVNYKTTLLLNFLSLILKRVEIKNQNQYLKTWYKCNGSCYIWD